MSWLKSVNNMLEKLDDRVETAREDASNILVDSDGVPAKFTRRFLGNQTNNDGDYDDDDESGEDSYYEDEDAEEDYDENEEDTIEAPASNLPLTGKYRPVHSRSIEITSLQTKAPVSAISDEQQVVKEHDVLEQNKTDEDSGHLPSKQPPSRDDRDFLAKSNVAPEPKTSVPATPVVARPPSSANRNVVSAPRSQTSTVSASKANQRRSDERLQKENQKLLKENSTLKAQLEAAQAEVIAQQKELEQAADRLDEDRQLADEEREDLMDEHEEALKSLKESYEARLELQKDEYESRLNDTNQKLVTETKMRVQEGGDMTEELENALQREREALHQVDKLETEKDRLERAQMQMKEEAESLENQIKSLTESSQAAVERERQAEERLDAANEVHKRALANRKARESELERTVAELGAALASKGSSKSQSIREEKSSISSREDATVPKSAYEMVLEELESTKGQLTLSNQRCDALQTELTILSNERTEQARISQAKQHEHDQKVVELTTKISRLENSARTFTQDTRAIESETTRQLTRDLDKARRQIASLSDQLLRQQGMTESSKSEVLALRGRLSSATAKLEAAEAGGGGRLVELESGGVGYNPNSHASQRRVKMGRGVPRGGRTIRSALGLQRTDNSALDQVAQTVDALDLWMMETGNIMKHEPLARLGLLLYLVIVHLWCFGLVFFHGLESERADLGTLTSRRAVLGVAHHQQNPLQ